MFGAPQMEAAPGHRLRSNTVFYLKTLGEFSLRASGPKGPPLLSNSKPLAVVAYLATTSDRSARREHIAQLLWPGADASHARSSLRQALFYISQRVGRPLVRGDEVRVELAGELLDADIWEFERALAAEDFERVVELYGGAFVPGLERKAGPELEGWIEAEDEKLRAGLEVAYTRLIAGAMEQGNGERAVGYARRYVELNPLSEPAQLALIRSLRVAGDDVGALRAYRSYRSLLREALDGEPSDELERLIASVRDEVLKDPVPDGVDGAKPWSRRRITWRWVAASAAVGALVAVLGFVGLSRWGPWRDRGLLSGAAGVLWVEVGDRGERTVFRVEYRGGGLEFEATNYASRMLPSPDGRRIAARTASENGWNLAIGEARTGAVRTVTSEPLDEEPVGWSPDGRFVLYRQGVLLGDASGHSYVLMSYDRLAGARRLLSDLYATVPYDAAWSPDGTRIAFAAGGRVSGEVHVIEADGSARVNLSDHPGDDRAPAWSPDGVHVAFASDRSGSGDIYTVHADGSELVQVTDTPIPETQPVWLSETVLAFIAETGGAADLWAIDVTGAELQRLTQRGDIGRVIAAYPDVPGVSWLAELTIAPTPALVSPGQYVQFGAGLRDARGSPVDTAAVPIRWSVSDTAVASLVAPRWLHVRAVGATSIIGSAGGWISDTLPLESRELVEVRAPLLKFEDWSRGIVDDRWVVFGEPLPYARPLGGPEGGGVLVSNGDESFTSGVASRRAFAPDQGLTLEAWGRMPFSGQLYQAFGLGLSTETPNDSADWVHEPVLQYIVDGLRHGVGPVSSVFLGSRVFRPPAPPEPDRWCLYAFQLARDGTVSIIIDGRLHWRSPEPFPMEGLGPLHVVLGYRSYGAEIAHGPLRVYYGSRYVLPEEGNVEADQ